MARRSEHSQDEIKQMVLEAAEMIVVEEGFSQLKVRKIAMEIGYTVGSIYMVFDNMADLILHLKARVLSDMYQNLAFAIKANQPKEIMPVLAKTYVVFACQNFNRWQMIFETSSNANENRPIWYQQKMDSIFNLIESQFQQLSSLSTDEQNKQAAHVFWGSLHGICHLSLKGQLDSAELNLTEKKLMLLVDNFIKGWMLSLVENN